MKLRERMSGLKHMSRGVRPDPDEAQGEKVGLKHKSRGVRPDPDETQGGNVWAEAHAQGSQT